MARQGMAQPRQAYVGGKIGLGANLAPCLRQGERVIAASGCKYEVLRLPFRLLRYDGLRGRWQDDGARFSCLASALVCSRRKDEPPMLQIDMRPAQSRRFSCAASSQRDQPDGIGHWRADAPL